MKNLFIGVFLFFIIFKIFQLSLEFDNADTPKTLYFTEKVRGFSLHISEIFSGFLLFFLKKLLHFYWKRFTIKLFLNFLEMKKNGQVRLEGDYSSSFQRKIFKRRKNKNGYRYNYCQPW